MIDSVDELRFTIMANELQILLESEGFDTKIPLLLYANKADQHEAK